MKANRFLVIDPQLAGISGDMLLAALIDLGADLKLVRESVRSVGQYVKGCRSVDLSVREVRRGEFRAKQAQISVDEKYETRTGSELLEALDALCDANAVDRFHKNLAMDSLRTLIEAEAKLHGERSDSVELDEAGSADTLADLIGIASALENLDVGKTSEVYCLPVAVGGGLFKFSHGTVQAPAPAVISIASAHHLPIVGGPVAAELATPTGMSVLANLVRRAGKYYPAFTPEGVGYGAGRRQFAGFPNVLRMVIGKQDSDAAQKEDIAILETNLDDVTGETLGFLMERLRAEGALDAHVIPATGKKNRPTHVLRVVARGHDAKKLEEIIFEESGTLGVRTYHAMREVASRKILRVSFKIDGKTVKARVKVSRDVRGRIVNVKPEYEDLAGLARRFGIPLRRVYDAAVREAEKKQNL